MPIENLLARDFGYWRIKPNGVKPISFGLSVLLSEAGTTPVLKWYWAIDVADEKWVVDYPPVKLEEYVSRKKAAIQEREEQKERVLEALEPKARPIKSRLIQLSEKLVIGTPMLFQVELTNGGNTSVHYLNYGLG